MLCLFISHAPFSTPFKTVSQTSSRRPRTTLQRRRLYVKVCADRPESVSGDPEWMNLAKSIGTDSDDSPEKESTRPSPKWTYPEGDPRDVGDSNPWELWNSAKNKSIDEKIEERDTKAETDFWRKTARDVVQSTPSTPVSPKVGDDLQGMPVEEMINSEQVWNMARGVTGDMSTLQDELLTELNEYDPMKKSNDYRNAAREIVQQGSVSEGIEKADIEAQAGSGWNPDVDWMRFDDVSRDESLSKEAANRKRTEEQARKSMEEQLRSISNTEENINTNNSPGVPDGTDGNFTIDGRSPGFIKNRLRSGGTYGGSRYGAEEQAQELIKQGYELRDPKSDTDSWKSVAQDLIKDVPKETLEDEDQTHQEGTETQPFVEDNENNSNAWYSWIQGSIRWNQANAEIKERDPKQEVDMWRSSARDLIDITAVPTSKQDISTLKSDSTESNAWASWREANANWESNVGISNDQGSDNLSFKDDTKVDWGAGLGKTNSERNAWENWNRTVGWDESKGSDQKMWWNTRWDGSSLDEQEPEGRFEFIEKEPMVNGERDERIQKNSSIDEWRSIAKSLKETGEDQVENR